MDPELYRAAMEGNVEVLVQQKDQLEAQLTPNKNCVLHVAALFNNNSTLVKEILAAQPLLLCKVNIKGDTALHIAAREGHFSIVQALVECTKEMDNSELESGIGMAKNMLRMVNSDGNTALHKAVWNKDHLNIVELLVDEDPEFSHPANNDEETPLYIAAMRGFEHIVSKILNSCTSPTYRGPDGKTALHGAVTKDCQGCTAQLLKWKQSLAKESDIHGWTPLHYAAGRGLLSRVKQLLDVDKSVAYLTTYEDNRITPLHLAVMWGNIEVMKVLISECPDCWEMVDSKGQNILHLALRNLIWEAANFIRKDYRLGSLINQKDDEGNTPLHVLVGLRLDSSHVVFSTFLHNMLTDPRVINWPVNKEKLTPRDVHHENQFHKLGRYGPLVKELVNFSARPGWKNFVERQNDHLEKRKKAEEECSKLIPTDITRMSDIAQQITKGKMSDTYLIVAAFVATVTFAAGFTVPGGFDSNEGSNQGMAILTKAAAFKAFVISDTIAMMLSICSVFLHFVATFYKEQENIINNCGIFNHLVLLAVGAMIVAFMTGMYAVLAQSQALAISVCSIISFSLILFFALLRKKMIHDAGVDVMRELYKEYLSSIKATMVWSAKIFTFVLHRKS